MKRFPVFLAICGLLSISACQTTGQKSPVEALLADEGDPVDAMRFPDRETSAPVATDNDVLTTDQMSQLQNPVAKKHIVVSGNNVPLRVGPGGKYRMLGTADKGDRFKLLGTQADADSNEFWYLAEDSNENKIFISSLLSQVVQGGEASKGEKIPIKEEVQSHRDGTGRNLRTVFDPTPPLPKELKRAKHITLNFEGTELYDVITTFAELLKLDYYVEANIQGKVTLQTFNKIPVRDLYSLLEQILVLHNISVVKDGHLYRFIPTKDAAKKPLNMYFGDDPGIPSKDRMIIQIIKLKYISVEAMQKIITPLMTANASFIEVPETQNLMMVEMASNVKRILKVVNALDIDKLASSDIQLYKLQHANSETVVEELQEIFSSMGYREVLGNSLNFLALNRLNSVMVVNAFESILPAIEFWVNKLDQPISEGQMSTFVYYVQNKDAVQMADILSSMFQTTDQQDRRTTETGRNTGRNTRTGANRDGHDGTGNATSRGSQTASTSSSAQQQRNTPGSSTERNQTTTTRRGQLQATNVSTQGGIQQSIDEEIAITPDPSTNSLIIRTSPKNFPSVLELIHKLDIFPQQVLIEVLILDLELDEQNEHGIEFLYQSTSKGTTFGGNSTQSGSNLTSLLGGATSFPASGSFFVVDPGRLAAQLHLFASDNKTNILANPILVTTNNKPANISITDEIPISSSTLNTTTDNPTTSTTISFRNVGIKLDITPKINSDNFVNLIIRQEISSRGPDVNTGATVTPSFNIREVNTEVVLKDNQVLVMGGLMRTDIIDSHEGIPFLKDIPILGNLFGSKSRETSKTELMLFITPHIISNQVDSNFTTQQFRNRLGKLKKAMNQS